MSEHHPEQEPNDSQDPKEDLPKQEEDRDEGERGPDESVERPRSPQPQVWIACLAAYNNGTLHGEWVDAAVSHEELSASAQRILASSPEPDAEEYAIFDHDEFGAFRVGEYENLEIVALVARGIAEHGPAFAVWAELHDADPEMLEQFQDAYLGEYESPEAWAREVLAGFDLDHLLEAGGVSADVRPYVRLDYEAWAWDARHSGSVHVEPGPGGGVFVFAIH